MENIVYGNNHSFFANKFVKNAKVSNKKVLVRCDFNVPFANGGISDSRRIDEALETINYLIHQNAIVILCSHLGRPHGEYKESLSLEPIRKYLEQKLNKSVPLLQKNDYKFDEFKSGDICILENLRFNIGEENCELEFAKLLSKNADVFVNDAFGTCHRSHASLVLLPKLLPSFYGFLVKKEINKMSSLLKDPKRPFVSILGGAKVSDKINVINSFLSTVDTLIIGGGMTYTFLKALGYSVGDSICELSKLELAKNILKEAKDKKVKILFPIDTKVADDYSPDAKTEIVDSKKIPDNWQGLDIGPKTIELFISELKNAKTVVWNGPLGVSEWEKFENGTNEIAKAVAKYVETSIVGGGDSAAAIKKLGLDDEITHISTGGGASLMFFEGEALPAISAIMESEI